MLRGAPRQRPRATGSSMAVSLRSDPAGLVGVDRDRGPMPAADGAAISATGSAGPHWGRGLATEAAAAMAHAHFAYAGGAVLTVETRESSNPASRRVLEKAGFVPHGNGDGALPRRAAATMTCDRFRLERAAWSSRSAIVDCDRAA